MCVSALHTLLTYCLARSECQKEHLSQLRLSLSSPLFWPTSSMDETTRSSGGSGGGNSSYTHLDRRRRRRRRILSRVIRAICVYSASQSVIEIFLLSLSADIIKRLALYVRAPLLEARLGWFNQRNEKLSVFYFFLLSWALVLLFTARLLAGCDCLLPVGLHRRAHLCWMPAATAVVSHKFGLCILVLTIAVSYWPVQVNNINEQWERDRYNWFFFHGILGNIFSDFLFLLSLCVLL